MGELNKARAEWAQESLDAFPAKDDGEDVQNIKDLICNLGHLLMKNGLSVEEAAGVMERATEIFCDEVQDDE